MDSLPVRRKSCLLRLRENCPFRKLRRQTYDVSAANSSPIGPSWINHSLPTNNQPISTAYSEPRPPPARCRGVCSPDQSEAAADIHMEDQNQQDQNQNQNQDQDQDQNQNDPGQGDEERMDLDDDVDPETGERAEG